MIRIVSFLLLIALAAAGAAWVADQAGDVTLTWGGWRVQATLPVFALAIGIVIAAALLAWSILNALFRTPGRIRRGRRERRHARGRHAVTQGLLAVGHGDSTAARQHAQVAQRLAGQDPLALLLHAQSAQLDGDRARANAAFRAMAEREDTRLLGLRGLFIEAQRADDPVAAVMVAEEALKISPSSTWASHAVLGFRCAQGDWAGALRILDNDLESGLIDKATYRRRRGVLLTARALELETQDRDLSRENAMEAVKLAPTLVPAAVLASKFESEAHQVRRAMRLVETAWLVQPHPDLADAYAHVRLGDSARQRLVRVETLAAKTPGHIEGALAIARAAIDAAEFARAREALAPFIAAPTQRVAMLMAEIERIEHGDSGRARAWTLRAVRARHDPVWTADGYVSDRWRPVSPVTGRLDAFQWQTPVASLPSDKTAVIESSPFEDAMLAAPPPPRARLVNQGQGDPGQIDQGQINQGQGDRIDRGQIDKGPVEPPRVIVPEVILEPATQDNLPPAINVEPKAEIEAENSPAPAVESDTGPAVESKPSEPAASVAAPAAKAAAKTSNKPAEPVPVAPPEPAPPPESLPASMGPAPLFRTRTDLGKPASAPIPAVIPILRAPDDPGIDDEAPVDEFTEKIGTSRAQAGGWRGFLSRWGG